MEKGKIKGICIALLVAAAAFFNVRDYLDEARQIMPEVTAEETVREVIPADTGTQAPQEETPEIFPVNINTADADALQQLSGIGPAKAEAILAYRSAYGNFVSIEEIMEVKGIGEGIFSKIRDQICIGD